MPVNPRVDQPSQAANSPSLVVSTGSRRPRHPTGDRSAAVLRSVGRRDRNDVPDLVEADPFNLIRQSGVGVLRPTTRRRFRENSNRGRSPGTWTAIVVWNIIGIWDAMSAFVVHQSVTWPDLFMIEVFGPSRFLAAGAMHSLNLWLVPPPNSGLSTGLPRDAGVELREVPARRA